MPEELEGRQLEAALEYNERRRYDTETVEAIQRVVGAVADGLFGRGTTNAVWRWQGEVGLEQDGKVGPATLAVVRLCAAAQARGPAKLGVWLDDRPRTALDEAFFDELVRLHLDVVAVMVHRSTAGGGPMWRPRWTAAQLDELRELAQPRGIELVLTTWPLPNRAQLETFARELPAMLEASAAVGLEVDTEGNWTQARLEGYADMDEAAAALVDTLRAAAAPTGARLELTTYPLHPENGPEARVAPHMDRLFPQAYSVAERKGRAVAWDGRLGPGGIQTLSVGRACQIPGVTEGGPELALGLAAYDQTYPERTPAEAMQRALDRARALGAVELRYWSSKWILGHMSESSSMREFFAGLELEEAPVHVSLSSELNMPMRPTSPTPPTPPTSPCPSSAPGQPAGERELATVAGGDALDSSRWLEDLRGSVEYES
jgi:hypothetical protein